MLTQFPFGSEPTLVEKEHYSLYLDSQNEYFTQDLFYQLSDSSLSYWQLLKQTTCWCVTIYLEKNAPVAAYLYQTLSFISGHSYLDHYCMKRL